MPELSFSEYTNEMQVTLEVHACVKTPVPFVWYVSPHTRLVKTGRNTHKAIIQSRF